MTEIMTEYQPPTPQKIERGKHYEIKGNDGAWYRDGNGHLWIRQGTGLYIETKNEVDESGRVNTVTLEGTEGMFNCDSIIIAVSQSPRNNIVANTTGLDTNKWGLLVTDNKGNTTRKGVFASGDVVTGANTVVHAVAYAKVVAEEIEKYCEENI